MWYSSLKATISELITATEIAERAVAGLKTAVRDCDRDIGERLRAAERFSVHVAQQIKAGEDILARLAKIASATQAQTGKSDALTPAMLPPAAMLQVETPDPNAMLAAKMRHVQETGAEFLGAADNSCLTPIGGGLSRLRTGVATLHLAEILASTEGDGR